MFTQFDSEFYSSVRGALLIVFIYHIIIYYQNKRKLYLFFSVYALLLFIYFLRDLIIKDYTIGLASYINYPLQYITVGVYLKFSRELLQTKIYIPKWDNLLSLSIKILLVLSATLIVINATVGFHTQQLIFYFSLPILFAFIVVLFVKFSRINGVHAKIFILFSAIYYALLLVTYAGYIYHPFNKFLQSVEVNPMFFFFIGGTIKIIMIAAIIGFRIKELEENRIKTELLLSKQIIETSELKMTALQSQMNPHFLFNSLNSINNFIIKSQIEKASDYITKFSKLIREILKNSQKNTISLAEELSNLKIYVLLENIRIEGGFTYEVEIDPQINTDLVKVPPLFIQPYVENAIWHGLMHIEGEKKIKLIISKMDDLIKFEIIDNGIGIAKAKEKQEIQRDERLGFATKATDIRIKTLFQSEKTLVKLEDISNKTSSGTKATIVFPLVEF
ncbi:MAG: histidine kinase [Bacteroidetes bacterium]|nr:histidine kinase [Bacteroidota bacterium]